MWQLEKGDGSDCDDLSGWGIKKDHEIAKLREDVGTEGLQYTMWEW